MAIIPKILKGGLDLNSSVATVAPNNYVDAVDVTDKSVREENGQNVWQLNNNVDYAFSVGSIEAQAKIYKFKIDFNIGGDPENPTLSYPPNTDLVFTLEKAGQYRTRWFTVDDGGLGLPINNAGLVIGWKQLIEDWINGVFGYMSPSLGLAEQTDTSLTYILSLGFYGNSDWNLTIQTSRDGVITDGLFEITCEPLQDAFSAEKAGKLKPIMIANKGNEVIFFNTTGNKETTKQLIQVNFSTYWYIDTTTEFIDGEEVFISGQSDALAINVSGYFTLTFISLVGITYTYSILPIINPITEAYLIDFGTYTFTRFRNTASTIGIARKNENSGEWNYLELLRSNKLNFRTYKQIRDAIITSTDFGTNSDWTDGLNPIRRLLYKGDWIENGYLTVYNPDALYSLDTIGEESKLQLGQNTSKVTMSAFHVGGTKPEATYIAFVRFGSVNDGVQTSWSHYSNTVWTHSNNLATHQYNSSTTFSLIIKVEQIPLNQFSTLQIGIAEIGSKGSFITYTLPEVQIGGLTEVTVTDIGDTTKYGTWDGKNEVEIPLVVFENTNNLLDFDNYIITADVKLAIPYDLSEWAKSFTFNVATRLLTISNDAAEYQQNLVWLNEGYNNWRYMSNEWLSAMPSETHRMAVAIEWKNGAPTTYFWCKDIYFEPIDNWHVNPHTSTFTSEVYQYYIEVSGINIDYLLPDGQLVKDVVKDIRFARTAVVQEVLVAGVGFNTYDDGLGGDLYINANYPTDNSPAFFNNENWLLFSPDLINNGQTIQYEAGDEIIMPIPNISNVYTVPSASYEKATDYHSNFGSGSSSTPYTLSVTEVQDLFVGQKGKNVNLTFPNPANLSANALVTGCLSVKVDISSGSPQTATVFFYYRRKKADALGDSPYKTDPLTDRFFIVPQDIWYDEATHTEETVYKVFGGDCYPQKQYYRVAKDEASTSSDTRWSNLIGFYSYNRSNGAMRSGTPKGYGFPNQSILNVLNDSTISDDYMIDTAFYIHNQFQSRLPYNPNLLYTKNTISTIYYSGKRLNGALYGNNRIWDFNSNGVIENVYGRITDLSILLGTSGNNAIFVKQERNTTLQYFDNTARLITTSVEAILGTGGVLDTKGTFLTVSGNSHKFAKAKCLSPTSNKEFDIWFDINTRTFNRFGADGSRVISDSISSFLLKYTTLANLNEYNNPDRPAHDYGLLARWDNQKKEYVFTARLIVKGATSWDITHFLYHKGDLVYVDPATDGFNPLLDTIGFEGIPTIYKAIADNVGNLPSTSPNSWVAYRDYIDEYHQCYTLVWNELDNAWKGFYSYLPNIYGNSANNYLSGHPTNVNLVYEHNQDNQARYYCSIPQQGYDITTIIDKGQADVNGNIVKGYQCAAQDMADFFGVSTFPYSTEAELANHKSYYIVDQSVTPYRYYRIVNFISPFYAEIDANEDLYNPSGFPIIITSYYSTCNTGQPLLEGVFNEGYPRYFSFGDIQLNIDSPPNKIETVGGLDSMGQKTTKSYMEYADFKYAQGQARVASGTDTTNGKTNKRGLQGIEGYWMKLKTLFQPNIKNKMQNQQVIVVEQNKKMK